MADGRLRQLERTAWQGDSQAQVRLLLQRVRVGDLPRHSLALAAYLRHTPACEAVGKGPSPIPDLPSWVEGLEPWGRDTCARAAVRAASMVRGPFENWLRLQPAACSELRSSLDAARAWLQQGADRDRDAAERRYVSFLTRAGHRLYGMGPDHVAANAVSDAVRSVFQRDFAVCAGNAVRHAVKARSPRDVLLAIRRDLLPLALESPTRAVG